MYLSSLDNFSAFLIKFFRSFTMKNKLLIQLSIIYHVYHWIVLWLNGNHRLMSSSTWKLPDLQKNLRRRDSYKRGQESKLSDRYILGKYTHPSWTPGNSFLKTTQVCVLLGKPLLTRQIHQDHILKTTNRMTWQGPQRYSPGFCRPRKADAICKDTLFP